MRSRRQKLYVWLADWAVLLSANRMNHKEVAERMRRLSFDNNVTRMGVRMTDFLRDRLRRRWLRIRK
jgi:hypothetical protein